MRSVVIYDSQYGNTRLLAEAIAAELEAVGTVDIENARNEDVTLPPDLTLLVVGGPTPGARRQPATARTARHHHQAPPRWDPGGGIRHARAGATFPDRCRVGGHC